LADQLQQAQNEFCRGCRDVEWRSEPWPFKSSYFFCQSVMLEVALVNRACRLPALDAPQILFDWQREQKVMDFGIVKTTLQIGKF
jgi:hypothetical protein